MLKYVMENGEKSSNRTGIDTYSVFGYQTRYDLSKGFPLLTTKRMFIKGIIHELLWFLSGDTNVKYLKDNGVGIWDEWATKEKCEEFGREEGNLGKIYGHQWRNFGATDMSKDGVDQISNLIEEIKTNPKSRRLIVTGWNPKDVDQVHLPPCHTLWQCHVSNNGKLSLHLYQRSADIFLGVPFNIASYSLLCHMIAQVCDLRVGEFVHTFGDLHLYENHMDQAKLLLTRKPLKLPSLCINPDVKNIFDFKYSDFEIKNYVSATAIKAPVAV